ncbi:hypothetical protein [Piscinibacter sakaiensis]|uniref:hypothetical protein n=1 Tax=Piscinibacter sakaiensis TaxID=1547922 RepID=UPI003AAA8ACE
MAGNAALESRGDAGVGGSYLPGLIGIAAALAIWMLAQPVVDEAHSLRQQIGIAGSTRSLSGDEALLDLEALAREAAGRRAAIEARLQTVDPPAIAHAKVLHDLRQRCAAAGIQNCAVKYVDDAVQTGTQRPSAQPANADGSAAPTTLVSLGLARSKAVISGQFQDVEFRNLVNDLERQDNVVWRLTGLTVRANRFDLDAELITRGQPATAGGVR